MENQSLSEINSSVAVIATGNRWKRFMSFFGPAYLISVGYMDPGNWATDLAGGSQYGYSLLWVLVMSNAMALLLQSLSARLGIVRGRDLAQANREFFPRYINYILYGLAEIAIAACDLAEVLGMAIGINLLTGLPLIYGVSITILDTFLLLYLQRLGVRKLEAFIIGLISIIALCFLYNIIMAKPHLAGIMRGLIPSLPNANTLYAANGITGKLPSNTALYLAIGIIGATVMPHNLYLHSSLVQTRSFAKTIQGIKQAIKYNFIDTLVALNLAFFVNAAILILAASVFFYNNHTGVAELKDAYKLLPQVLNNDLTAKLFAIALIASGQSSTITGTLAGQIVMEGYLQLRINPWVRRLLTRLLAVIPAFIVILIYGDDEVDALLVFSQVILSMQLGFAIIPLIHFVSNKSTMGVFVIKPWVKFLAWLIASILVGLNINLLLQSALPVLSFSNFWVSSIVIVCALLFILLLFYVTAYPIFAGQKMTTSNKNLHNNNITSLHLTVTQYSHITIALDFDSDVNKILSAATGIGNKQATYLLIHVVETATAKVYGNYTQDHEALSDAEQLQKVVLLMQAQGYNTSGALGYRNRKKEIIRLATESKTQLLVMGSHGHKGFKDIWYGETVNSVRHQLNIPVFIVGG